MNVEFSQWTLLGDQAVCSAEYLAEISGLSNQEIEELIDYGVIMPVDIASQPLSFHLRHVVTANTARRLRDDFELDQHGLTLAMTLMRRMVDLQEQLDALRARIEHAR